MSENLQNPTVAPAAAPAQAVSTQNMAMIVYVLYLVSYVVGLTALVGIILAHVNAGSEKDPVVKSHYSYQIRTFWWGLLWLVIGSITIFILIGYLILLFWFVWTLYRCIKGLSALNRNEAIA